MCTCMYIGKRMGLVQTIAYVRKRSHILSVCMHLRLCLCVCQCACLCVCLRLRFCVRMPIPSQKIGGVCIY